MCSHERSGSEWSWGAYILKLSPKGSPLTFGKLAKLRASEKKRLDQLSPHSPTKVQDYFICLTPPPHTEEYVIKTTLPQLKNVIVIVR